MTDYTAVRERMGEKADRDSRACWIAGALGCSRETKRHLRERAARSHRAWERAFRRETAAYFGETGRTAR
jgi:hypothetical protein